MPGPHHQSGRPKQSRYTQPKPNVSKMLKSRLGSLDATSLAFSGQAFILLASLLTCLFNWRFLYKAACLVQAGLHGWAGWKAYKSGGRKVNLELFKEPAVPYFFLAAFLFYMGRLPLLPIQLASAVHAGLALMKLAANNPGALLNPSMKQQAKQFADFIKGFEPKGLQLVSHLEILSVPWTFLATIRGQQSLFLPLLILQFVRFLLVTQPRMEKAWGLWLGQGKALLDKVEAMENVPPSVKAILIKTKLYMEQSTNNHASAAQKNE